MLTGYGSVDPKSPECVRRAIAMLGGLYIGLSLPDYALGDVDLGGAEAALPGRRRPCGVPARL